MRAALWWSVKHTPAAPDRSLSILLKSEIPLPYHPITYFKTWLPEALLPCKMPFRFQMFRFHLLWRAQQHPSWGFQGERRSSNRRAHRGDDGAVSRAVLFVLGGGRQCG